MVKFVNEIEFLFIRAVEIEYEYYIKKEQQKEEQARLREQMRQEAEDRKVLEQQKKQIEIARKMREDGISIDTIIKYTGLQSSDIENL